MVYNTRQADWLRQKLIHERIDDNPPRCQCGCNQLIPAPRKYQGNVKYLNAAHRNKVNTAKAKDRAALKRAATEADLTASPFDATKTRKGELYQAAIRELSEDVLRDWAQHKIPDAEISRMLNGAGTPQALGRVRKQLFNELLEELHNQNFTPQEEALELLGPTDAEMLALSKADPAAFKTRIYELADAFVAWRTRFFTAGGMDGAYITRPMHREWIAQTLAAIYLHRRQLILSPPRHGKTDLLIHFCVWLIIRNPSIRILWVGPNSSIAENCLGQVKNLLASHDELRQTYLPPGDTWQPQQRNTGLPWSADKFTVATRPSPLKQPTMWCAGVEGGILSLDADFIVVDDPADPDRSQTPGGRDAILNWFRQKLITRKMFITGLVMISSRVHASDLYSNFVDSDNWQVHVDRAHDIARCGNDLFYGNENDHPDCILFPEINPLQHLREQADDVGPALFEMMYLNHPRPEGSLIFDPEQIRAKCLDNLRDLGTKQLTGHYRLVAGLDPAARGYQAAFCWAVELPNFDPRYDPKDPRYQNMIPKFSMVDLENTKAGGVEGAAIVMEDWYLKYGVKLWVIEDNSYGMAFFDDPRIKSVAAKYGLVVRPTHTGRNKHDPHFGVAGQADDYHQGRIRLPYGTPEAVRKTDMLITQLVNFTGDTQARLSASRRPLSDILMSSWFPFPEVIRRWQKELRHFEVKSRSGQSFPGYNKPSYDRVPWGGTRYTTDQTKTR